ncbi:MAG TPA: DUF523 domain-containing protein, partial [Lachnospiraceae bacterium]|nr:DUF523 domain-containing protein [Lachnospiraceae bacterium]
KDQTVVEICPEMLAGLSAPRPCAEIVDGIVTDSSGNSVDEIYKKGVACALEKIKDMEFDLVVLQSRSPTCGVNQIYDGRFLGKLKEGQGLFARALIDAGYHVVDIEDAEEFAGGKQKGLL